MPLFLLPDVSRVFCQERPRSVGLYRNGKITWLPRNLSRYLWCKDLKTLPRVVAEFLTAQGLTGTFRIRPTVTSRTQMFLGAITDRFLLDTTENKALNARILIIGAGGLGSNLAIQLASLGVTKLSIVDGDCVEESNLNRLFWAVRRDIGKLKVDVLMHYISDHFGVHLDAVPALCDATLLRKLTDSPEKYPALTVLALDRPKQSKRLASHLHRRKLPYMLCGYSGAIVSVGPIVKADARGCPYCGSNVYMKGMTRSVAASAFPNNSLCASVAASAIASFLITKRSFLSSKTFRADLRTGHTQLSPIAIDPQCSVCGPQRKAH